MEQAKGYKKALKQKNKAKSKLSDIIGKSYLRHITPRKGYAFKSNYFKIDDSYATILTIFNQDGSDDNLSPMWGLNLIPYNRNPKITSRLLVNVERMKDNWVEEHQTSAEKVVNGQSAETNVGGSLMAVWGKHSRDLNQITDDIVNGASYMKVSFRIMIKAPTLDLLDTAVEDLQRYYSAKFAKLYVDRFDGQQADDMYNLFNYASRQLGRNYEFTSTEFAGSYNLVTHGVEDPHGDYMGNMVGDVNNSAVLWDIDAFHNYVVVAATGRAKTLSFNYDKVRSSTLWGVKLAQNALRNGHRVVHFVLNGANLNSIGVDLSEITTTIAMNRGDINPFESFGSIDDELSALPKLTSKIRLMVKQLNNELDEVALNILNRQLEQFYIAEGLWRHDAPHHRNQLRIVGIPHKDVPKLQRFRVYLQQAYVTSYKQKGDPVVTKSLMLLATVFERMLAENGDLFNTITSSNIDRVKQSYQVVYNFSSLLRRGRPIAMAQFVNALSFAIDGLHEGDLIVFHGVDQLDEGVLRYTKDSISGALHDGVRVAYLYDDIEAMLHNTTANSLVDLARADWILTGQMTNPDVDLYEKLVGERIPNTLRKCITTVDSSGSSLNYYLRRDTDNVVFAADPILEPY